MARELVNVKTRDAGCSMIAHPEEEGKREMRSVLVKSLLSAVFSTTVIFAGVLPAQASTVQTATSGVATQVAATSVREAPASSAVRAVPDAGIIWVFTGRIYPHNAAGYNACDRQGEVYVQAGYAGFSCRTDPVKNHYNLWVAYYN